jgi:hypothetical protein
MMMHGTMNVKIVTTASGNLYTVIERGQFTDEEYR